MTYASINEVWGGVSGNNQLTTPLEKTRHPIHQQQMNNKYPEPKIHTQKDMYMCKYGSHDCENVFKQNQAYNNQKIEVAQGLQQFPPQAPGPQNYTYLPQYPWYNYARNGYMMYGPQVSQMWYNDPMGYNPGVASQILMQQMYGGVNYNTPIGQYYPQGFTPIPPPYQVNPQLTKKQTANMVKRREDFGDNVKNDAIKAGIIYFIFFLVALAVILCIFMICIMSSKK